MGVHSGLESGCRRVVRGEFPGGFSQMQLGLPRWDPFAATFQRQVQQK